MMFSLDFLWITGQRRHKGGGRKLRNNENARVRKKGAGQRKGNMVSFNFQNTFAPAIYGWCYFYTMFSVYLFISVICVFGAVQSWKDRSWKFCRWHSGWWVLT